MYIRKPFYVDKKERLVIKSTKSILGEEGVKMKKNYMVHGIAVANPVDIEEEYLYYTIDYAIKNNYNHIQFIGPIHNNTKGNIDGMTEYVKYAEFNNTKDMEYVKYCQRVVNEACKRARAHGIKTYVWHHEVELPERFAESHPEALNQFKDFEVTAPVIKDFIEHKLKDFFNQYPLIDGFVLTLHETRVPLLKLANQKLDKIGRIKYVTKILYDTCKSLGKELIVRPFASLPEDYGMMMQAYEEISEDMVVFDKWTQFDWSLTLPHNVFFHKIKKNPMLVETDIFGEYFGKGRLPLMLYDHIKQKCEYSESFKSFIGYCSRIDRGGKHPFGQVNEVNLVIMNAFLKKLDVEKEIDKFFASKYGIHGPAVRKIVERTEEVLTKIIYLKGYYYSELSYFPQINHSKNHFYFEIMKKQFKIASNEWFIPIGWDRGSLESVYEEKDSALEIATQMFEDLKALEGKLDKADYKILFTQFANLYYCAKIWRELIDIFRNYIAYFDENDKSYKAKLKETIKSINAFYEEGEALLGDVFYCGNRDVYHVNEKINYVKKLTDDVMKSFEAECKIYEKLSSDQSLVDFVICGGGTESHGLQKEVNFSDTYVENGEIYRIPGTGRGKTWSTVNSHGWFSYSVKVKPNAENDIEIVADNEDGVLSFKLSMGNVVHTVKETSNGKVVLNFKYQAGDESELRVRIDRNSADTPRIYTICVR